MIGRCVPLVKLFNHETIWVDGITHIPHTVSMKTFKEILDLWANASELARDMSEKPSTVRKWKARNNIPAHKWLDLIAIADKQGVGPIPLQLLAELAKEAAPVRAPGLVL